MRVQLPPGYVPPEPTHPSYGYLTPEEQAEYDAAERARGVVPAVVGENRGENVGENEAVEGAGSAATVWSAPAALPPVVAPLPALEAETEPEELGEPESAVEAVVEAVAEPVAEPVAEAEEATVAHTGWVPSPPPPIAPERDPVSEPAALGAAGEFRWDARAQQWVATAAVEEPVAAPDVAAAAGGRGASSSWTSADGSRYRWDARAQQWVTEPPDPGP